MTSIIVIGGLFGVAGLIVAGLLGAPRLSPVPAPARSNPRARARR